MEHVGHRVEETGVVGGDVSDHGKACGAAGGEIGGTAGGGARGLGRSRGTGETT